MHRDSRSPEDRLDLLTRNEITSIRDAHESLVDRIEELDEVDVDAPADVDRVVDRLLAARQYDRAFVDYLGDKITAQTLVAKLDDGVHDVEADVRRARRTLDAFRADVERVVSELRDVRDVEGTMDHRHLYNRAEKLAALAARQAAYLDGTETLLDRSIAGLESSGLRESTYNF